MTSTAHPLASGVRFTDPDRYRTYVIDAVPDLAPTAFCRVVVSDFEPEVRSVHVLVPDSKDGKPLCLSFPSTDAVRALALALENAADIADALAEQAAQARESDEAAEPVEDETADAFERA